MTELLVGLLVGLGLLCSFGVGDTADDSEVVGMVGAALEEGGDVVDDEVGRVVWGVVDFGEAGAPMSVPDTVSFESGPAWSSPPGGFVGGVAVATAGVLVSGTPTVL